MAGRWRSSFLEALAHAEWTALPRSIGRTLAATSRPGAVLPGCTVWGRRPSRVARPLWRGANCCEGRWLQGGRTPPEWPPATASDAAGPGNRMAHRCPQRLAWTRHPSIHRPGRSARSTGLNRRPSTPPEVSQRCPPSLATARTAPSSAKAAGRPTARQAPKVSPLHCGPTMCSLMSAKVTKSPTHVPRPPAATWAGGRARRAVQLIETNGDGRAPADVIHQGGVSLLTASSLYRWPISG